MLCILYVENVINEQVVLRDLSWQPKSWVLAIDPLALSNNLNDLLLGNEYKTFLNRHNFAVHKPYFGVKQIEKISFQRRNFSHVPDRPRPYISIFPNIDLSICDDV
ncbi:Hypothetical protein RAK1035_3648 [Roseovarius sp. AK1035]|nr:Hypothetical protein RAK1035_3648 [Roseovarius sp. AK1035]